MQDVQGLQDVPGKRGYMIPKDYACDGQLNMWDYLSNNAEKPKPYEYNFNRFLGREVEFIIQGEKYRGKIVDFDPYYTWVVTDDGSEFACTSSNVYPLPEEEAFSCRECDIEKRSQDALFEYDILNCPEKCCRECFITKCGARCPGSEEPTLPSFEDAVKLLSEKYKLEFEKKTWGWKDENYFEYVAKYKGATIEIDEGHFTTNDRYDGERFIGLSYNCKTEGASCPCCSEGELIHTMDRYMERHERKLKTKKESKHGD